MSAREYYDRTFQLLQKHHQWFSESIPLIASENVSSPAVKEALTTDFGNRYAEGWPGEQQTYVCCPVSVFTPAAYTLTKWSLSA
jgi:glycine/serine hydroxymethyltransferase